MTQKYTLNANGPERSQVLANAHAFIDRLPLRKSWVVEVKEYRKVRSNEQNAALFGVAYPILTDATGSRRTSYTTRSAADSLAAWTAT